MTLLLTSLRKQKRSKDSHRHIYPLTHICLHLLSLPTFNHRWNVDAPIQNQSTQPPHPTCSCSRVLLQEYSFLIIFSPSVLSWQVLACHTNIIISLILKSKKTLILIPLPPPASTLIFILICKEITQVFHICGHRFLLILSFYRGHQWELRCEIQWSIPVPTSLFIDFLYIY